MKHFLNVDAIDNPQKWIAEAIALKANKYAYPNLGQGKTLGLLFFNNSLRTRISTQLAAQHLGIHTMVMNFGKEGWLLEYGDGTVMDGGSAEHIKEAAAVMGTYCDIIGVRAFAELKDKAYDTSEPVINSFKNYAGVPIINLESSLEHPLQAFADSITIEEKKTRESPKVVLSWAPHPRALPHAVANSFLRIMKATNVNLTITHPPGYELDPYYTGDFPIMHDQEEALEGADFVYTKNWSSYEDYGKVLVRDPSWMITAQKLKSAYFMHCLPVRRNVVVQDEVLDGPNSLVLQQAENRTFAAQLVLKKIIESL